MYIETSFMNEFGGVLSDVANKYQKKFEVTWYISNSKGNGIRKSSKPLYLKYFIGKIYSDHGYMIIMLFQNAKDKNAEMKRLNSKNEKGKLDPNITEYASVKFIQPLKKVKDVWYRQVSNSHVPVKRATSRQPIQLSQRTKPGTIPDRYLPFIASRFIDTIQ